MWRKRDCTHVLLADRSADTPPLVLRDQSLMMRCNKTETDAARTNCQRQKPSAAVDMRLINIDPFSLEKLMMDSFIHLARLYMCDLTLAFVFEFISSSPR